MESRALELKDEMYQLMTELLMSRPALFQSVDDLTPKEAAVIHMIGFLGSSQGAEVSPSRVASAMFITPAALSQLLRSLEEKGLVARERCADDSRSVTLALTEAGRAVARKVEDLWAVESAEVVALVGEDAMEQTLATLRQVIDYHKGRLQQLQAGR